MKLPIQMLLVVLALLHTDRSIAQQPAPKQRSVAAARDFDFWVGDWNLTWAGGGKGTNRITFELDSGVVMEHFDGGTSSPLRGISVSVYSLQGKRWQQTWVDNQGAYLDFTGGLSDGKMILSRRAGPAGREFLQRMVWFNITNDSLDWNWQRSDDNGSTWKTAWAIHYERKE